MNRACSRLALLMALPLAATLLALGCASGDPAPGPTGASTGAGIPAQREAAGDLTEIDTVAHTATRQVRRISLDSLQASLGIVAGNDIHGQPIYWRAAYGVNKIQFDGLNSGGYSKFGDELGRPNYLTETEESVLTTALYMKFMRDLATNVCSQMVEADRAYGPSSLPAGDRNLWRFAPVSTPASEEQVTQNLQYLVLRFLALKATSDAPLVASLREVYRAGETSTGHLSGDEDAQIEGWRGVCIAMLESPLFHLD
ncbi:MAG: hypothetical protein VB934_03840 [Polyangiaceae bacterium]